MIRSGEPEITENRAIAPIISVILMVLLTVLLASVIGTLVLNFGPTAGESTPQTSISIWTDTANNTISVKHESGDPLVDEETRVIVVNESDGERLTFEAGDSTKLFSMTHTFDIHLDIGTGAELVDGPWPKRTADSSETVETGTRYTVKFIDTETDRIITELTVTG